MVNEESHEERRRRTNRSVELLENALRARGHVRVEKRGEEVNDVHGDSQQGAASGPLVFEQRVVELIVSQVLVSNA